MKRAIVSFLGASLILGTAGMASAVHQEQPAETSAVFATGDVKVKLDGSIRGRGYYQRDTDNADDSSSDKTGYDGRIRLGVKATVSESAIGYVMLETGDGSGDNYTWGNGNASGLHSGGSKQLDGNTDLSILEGWLQYEPGMVGIKVGHMPVKLANKVFFDHRGSGDDAALVFANPSDSTHVALMAIKFDEGSDTESADDFDGYFALMTQKLKGGIEVGANYTFLESDADGTGVLGDDTALWNLGLYAKGKSGKLSYLADVEFQGGDYMAGVDQSAFACYLRATMGLEKGHVGALIGYGSGDDGSDPAEKENYFTLLTDTPYDVYIPGYRLKIPGQEYKNSGLANLLLVQVNAGAKMKCPLSGKNATLDARVSYMKLNEEVNGEDDIGTELLAVMTWKLTNGLSYKIEAAYLIAGDAWGDDPDDPVFLRNGLELKF